MRGAIAIAMCIATAAPSIASAADVSGLWLTTSGSTQVEIRKCGAVGYCGTIRSTTAAQGGPALDRNNKNPNLRGRPLVGIVMLDGFKGGPAKWTGGTLYNPADGNTYKSSLTLQDPDHLAVEGCVAAFLCRSQIWTRLKS